MFNALCETMAKATFFVMAGPIPTIHVWAAARKKTADARDRPGQDRAGMSERSQPIINIYDVASLTSSSAASASNSSDASP